MRTLKRNGLVAFTLVCLLALGTVGTAAFGPGSAGDGYATSAAEYDLIAGQNEVVGKVYVWDVLDDVYVQYVAGHDWCILETHVEVAGDASAIPQNRGGPIPGQFAQGETFDECATLAGHYIFEGAIEDGGTVAVAAHAKVRSLTDVVGLEPVAADGLVNPGAETGDMTGWDFTTGVVRAIEEREETTGIVLPFAGDYFFDMTETPAATAFMSQSLAVPGFDTGTFTAGGWIQTELFPDETKTAITENDYGELIVIFKDAADVAIGTPVTSGPIGNPVRADTCDGDDPGCYVEFEIDGAVPEGAVTAEYRINGFLVGGAFINVFVDDLYFDLDLATNIYRTESAWAEGTRFVERGNWATYATYEQGSGTLVNNQSTPAQFTFLVFDLGASADDLGGVAWVQGSQEYVAHIVCAEVAGDTAWFTYQIPTDAVSAPGQWVTSYVTADNAAGGRLGPDRATAVSRCENRVSLPSWGQTVSGEVIVHPGM